MSGKFSQVRELEEYSKIAGQLGENQFVCMRKIAHKVGLDVFEPSHKI